MIDASDVVTFHSENAPHNNIAWLAQVLLPNGKFWGVFFTGASEAEVISKAIALWNAEEAKRKGDLTVEVDANAWNGEKQDRRGQHFIGKVWMIHSQTREKIRIDQAQITEYEFKGYVRGGARSK